VLTAAARGAALGEMEAARVGVAVPLGERVWCGEG